MHFLKNIELFVLAAQKKSFTAAAKALRMPTSTASHHIAQLEKELGQQLFARTTRSVELTPPGLLLYQHFNNILSEGRVALESIKNMSETASGPLHVRMTSSFAISMLGPRLGKFHRMYPHIDLQLEVISQETREFSGECDLAVVVGSLPDSPLFCRKIALITRHLYASPDYLSQAGAIGTPDQLSQHNCIAMKYLEPESVWHLENGGICHDVPVRGTFSTNSVAMILHVVFQGVGVGPIGDFMAREGVEQGLLVRVLPDWSLPEIPIYALTNSKVLPARSKVFIDFLISELAALM